MNKISYFLLISLFLSFFHTSQSQDKERVRSNFSTTQQGGLYNFGEEGKVNIEVSIWGYIKFPGKYIIPQGSTIVDLISYAGGPLAEANLDDIRFFRPQNDTLKVTKNEYSKLDYNDLFWEKEVINTKNRNITLKPGDMFVFPGGPRYYFRDNLTLILSFVSTVVSITVLMVTIFKD